MGLSWVNYTQLHPSLKETALDWRNHPDVRKWMRNSEPIALSDHLEWIESLKTNSATQYFMVSIQDRPIGALNFYESDRRTYFGYFLDPSLLGSSLGLVVEYAALSFGFEKLLIDNIWAETFPKNHAAQNIHDFLGFERRDINSNELLESVLSKATWLTKKASIIATYNRLITPDESA